MFKERKSILLFIILVLLAGLACSGTQRLQRFIGVSGEASDASHDQWIDESGAETGVDLQPADQPDILGERPESSDSAESPENLGLDASLDNTTLGQHINSGDLIIEQIESTGGGTQGEIIEVVIINESGEEIVFEIPPGLVFSPINTGEQDLMVLDGEVVILEPGETIVFSPYVICIDASAATPSSGSVYQVSYLESGDLLAFAECVDEETDDTLSPDDIGLQFAVWSIANDGNVLEMPEITEAEEGAYAGLMEELAAIPGMVDTMEDMMGVFSEEWLQRCDISVGGEE